MNIDIHPKWINLNLINKENYPTQKSINSSVNPSTYNQYPWLQKTETSMET